MKKTVSLISQTLIVFLLFQPLILLSSVYAEELKMDYTNLNHLHAPAKVNNVEYQYDANGNLISDGERTIEWNEDNLPVKIVKGNTEVKFFYDASGQRIVKQVGEEKNIYVNQYYQLSVIGNQLSVTKYYFTQGRRIATNTTQPFTNHQQPVTNFYHHDYLGSTILTTDLNSQPVPNSLTYFPYGNSIPTSPSAPLGVSNPTSNFQFPTSGTNYLYTGQELDPESDLYNYNARLYNPKTGVFISADSVGRGNRYAYANNNPMIFTDPSGHEIDMGDGGSGPYLPLIIKDRYLVSDQAKAQTEVFFDYWPAIVLGGTANKIANLNIPIISPLAYQYAQGAAKVVQGGIEQDIALQLEGTKDALDAFVGTYLGIQAAGTAVDYGRYYWDYRQAGKEIGETVTFLGEPALREELKIIDSSIPLPDQLKLLGNGNAIITENKNSTWKLEEAVFRQLPNGVQELWNAKGESINDVQLQLRIKSDLHWQWLSTMDRANGTVRGWAVDSEGLLVRFNQETGQFERHFVGTPYGQLPITVIHGE